MASGTIWFFDVVFSIWFCLSINTNLRSWIDCPLKHIQVVLDGVTIADSRHKSCLLGVLLLENVSVGHLFPHIYFGLDSYHYFEFSVHHIKIKRFYLSVFLLVVCKHWTLTVHTGLVAVGFNLRFIEHTLEEKPMKPFSYLFICFCCWWNAFRFPLPEWKYFSIWER